MCGKYHDFVAIWWGNFQLKLFVLVYMYANNSISLTQTPSNLVSCPEYCLCEQGTHTLLVPEHAPTLVTITLTNH